MPEQPQPVEVTWLDSGMHVDEGWASAESYTDKVTLDRMTVVTVGLLMYEDDDVVMVGLSYDPTHENWYGAQAIARRNITSRRAL